MEKRMNSKTSGPSTIFPTPGLRPTETAGTAKPAAKPQTSGAMTTGCCKGITQDQIAERARKIWQAHGCAAGRDQENWLEAEAQLRKELGLRQAPQV
jgi:hypothetical protein